MLTEQHLDEKSLIEILGLESLPVEKQQELVDAAAEAVDMRCLERILDSLTDRDRRRFKECMEDNNEQCVQYILRSNNVEIINIVQQEIYKFKREMTNFTGTAERQAKQDISRTKKRNRVASILIRLVIYGLIIAGIMILYPVVFG
jgi:hypothetical protein